MTRAILILAVLLGACHHEAEPTIVANTVSPEDAQDDPWAVVNRLTQEHGVPTQSANPEPGGKVTKRDSADGYEEEFFVADIVDVVYVFQEAWTEPHVAEVRIRPDGPIRFRSDGSDWNDSTIPHVSFVFKTREAAEEAVRALLPLVRHAD